MVSGLALIAATLALSTELAMRVQIPTFALYPGVVASSCFLGAFFLSRTGRTRAAAWLLAFTTYFTPLLGAWANQPLSAPFDFHFYFPAIAVLFSVVLISTQAAAVFTALHLGTLFLITQVAFRLPFEQIISPFLGSGILEFTTLILGWVLSRDMAQLRQQTTDLRRARDEAVRASHAKSRFLTQMSHELRTPFTTVLGFTDLVLEELKTQGQDELVADLERVKRAGHHLDSLIAELILRSKVEFDEAALRPIELDPAALCRDCVGALRGAAARQHNSLNLTIQPDLGAMVTDRLKLRQVLMNLLGNANKFTRHGTIELSVSKAEAGHQEILVFEVIDNGIGMSEAEQAHIFEEFWQAAPTGRTETGGLGLGLSICASFAELLGGSIEVESAPGVGSRFRLSLPRGARRQPSEAAAADAPPSPETLPPV